MPITLDRSLCCDPQSVIEREWLITNKIGGYSAGTIAGVLTRNEHGLLVISPPDSTSPQLLLAKTDEEVIFDQRTYYLGTNEYRDGTLHPAGFVHLEAFRPTTWEAVMVFNWKNASGCFKIKIPLASNIVFFPLPTSKKAIAITKPAL